MGLWGTIKGAGRRVLKPFSRDSLVGNRGDNEFRDVDPDGNLGRIGGHGEAGYLDARNRQQGVYDQLGRQMTGESSLSAEQLRQALQQNLSAQRSAAAGARPGNQAMAARTAAMQMGRLGSGMAGQQALAGIAERNAAAQALGGLLGQQAGQDAGLASGMFGGIEQQRGSRFGSLLGVPTQQEQILGGLMGAGQFAALASDKRLKKNIAPGDRDADEFLRQLKSYSYDYKDKGHGKGRQLGVMAQDLERSSAGRQAVIDTPGGKMVHGAKLAGALAAALKRVDDRVRDLEGGK